MTSHTLQRFLVTILLVGTLIAPMALPARATVPLLQQAGLVVIDFEDLGTEPGMLTVVSDQYAGLGVTFNNLQVRNFAATSDDKPPFAHSGSLAAQHCFDMELCSTPLIMTFSEPQRRVKVWLGLESGIDEARQVAMTAFDAVAGGDEVASTTTTLGPGGGQDIPVQTPLEVTDPGGAIRRVVVGVPPPSEFANNLVFDDVEFEPAPGQVNCPAGTTTPEIAVDLPSDGSDVQIDDFTLQGNVETSAPLTGATLSVANGNRIAHLDVRSWMPQTGGAFGPIIVDNALWEGINNVTLTVGNCADTVEGSASITYSPIADGTRYEQLGMEVTQTIQDTFNSVKLIAGKRTFVRVYLRTIEGEREIRGVSGQLRGCTYLETAADDVPSVDVPSDDVQLEGVPPDCFGSPSERQPLEPLSQVIVNDVGDIQQQRVNLQMPVDDLKTKDVDESQIPVVMNYGLLFELPSEWTQAGHLRLRFDANSLEPRLPCDKCDAITDVEFVVGQPLALNLVDTWYELKGEPIRPDDLHHRRIESWLERAYPTDTVTVRTLTEVKVPWPPPTCYEVNAMLFEGQLAAEIASPSVTPMAQARYYGLVASPFPVADPAFSGCAGVGKDRTHSDQYASGPAGSKDRDWNLWDEDGSYADFYAGHELGHTFLRQHPGACSGESVDDDEEPAPLKGGEIADDDHHFVGFDSGAYRDDGDDAWQTTYPGRSWHDIMTYCEERWIASRTYEAIFQRMKSEATAPLAHYRMSAPVPGQRVLVVSGIIDLTNGSFIQRPLSVLPGDLVSSLPASSPYSIVLTDGAGGMASYLLNPRFFTDEPSLGPQFAQIADVVPWLEGTDTIEIMSGTTSLATIPVNSPPTVTLLSPNGGESLGGSRYLVRWRSSDTETETAELKHTLLYSTDDGVTWQTAAGNITDQEYLVDPDRLPGSADARFRIIVTDGVLTAQDDSDASFTVTDKAPRVSIVSPHDGATFTSDHTVVLTGSATDIELGELDGPALQWTSSLQGVLGEGRSIGVPNLTPGLHTITLTANDGVTPPQIASITIEITNANPPHIAWPEPLLPSQLRGGQFFYDSAEELGAFYTTDGNGGIQHLRSFDVLLNGWTAIVPGNFGGDETTDLLFYASQAGVGEFFSSDGDGGLQLLSGNEGFTRGWDIIVPGNFDDDAAGWTDLFFYNAEAGEGKFYTTDGTGRIRLLGEPGTYHTGWTSIVAGEFGGDGHPDLLFYDKAAGLAQLYTTDGQGGLKVLNDALDWTVGWDQVVPGNFGGGDGLTDLFLYDAETGNATFLAGNYTGMFAPLGDVEPFSTQWTTIVSGDFGGDRAVTDLFVYDAEQGLGRYYLTNGEGRIEQLSSSDAFPQGWDLIVPGYFESS